MRHGFFAVTRLHLGYILGYIMPKRQYGLYGKNGQYAPIFNKDLLNYLHYMDMKGRGYLVLLFSDSIGYSRLYFCC